MKTIGMTEIHSGGGGDLIPADFPALLDYPDLINIQLIR